MSAPIDSVINLFARFRPAPPRNIFLFGMLLGLVVVFSVFFLYLSASNDLATLRREFTANLDAVNKLKAELLGECRRALDPLSALRTEHAAGGAAERGEVVSARARGRKNQTDR